MAWMKWLDKAAVIGTGAYKGVRRWLRGKKDVPRDNDPIPKSPTKDVKKDAKKDDKKKGKCKGKCPPKISRQKQDRHVEGTKEHKQRVENGDPPSTFKDRDTADRLTKEAWEKGSPVRGDPTRREFDFGRVVGKHPNGMGQTRVRVHNGGSGMHGHPVGPTIGN